MRNPGEEKSRGRPMPPDNPYNYETIARDVHSPLEVSSIKWSTPYGVPLRTPLGRETAPHFAVDVVVTPGSSVFAPDKCRTLRWEKDSSDLFEIVLKSEAHIGIYYVLAYLAKLTIRDEYEPGHLIGQIGCLTPTEDSHLHIGCYDLGFLGRTPSMLQLFYYINESKGTINPHRVFPYLKPDDELK